MKRELFQPGYLVVAMASTVLLVPHLNANIPGSVPQNAGNSRPASPPFGQTYDVLSQEWWLWDFMQAVPDNPTSGAPCGNGQSGDVWFLYGLVGPATSVTCAIPAGKALFFPIINVECSSLEPFPFHGDTAQERYACAKAWIDHVSDVAVTIDGKAIENLAPLRTRSGDFSFTVPNNNILFVPGPAWGFSSADGYYVLLAPLSAGVHTIQLKGKFHDPFDPAHPEVGTINTTLTLNVAP
jgi:hypothetical protein